MSSVDKSKSGAMQLAGMIHSLLELLVLQVPSLLDTGMQLWNALEVNTLAVQGSISYADPLCCQGSKPTTMATTNTSLATNYTTTSNTTTTSTTSTTIATTNASLATNYTTTSNTTTTFTTAPATTTTAAKKSR